MKTICINCGTSFDPDNTERQYGRDRCPRCGWKFDEKELGEEEERYLVLLSLIYRIKVEGEILGGGQFRIVPTSREMAVLQHGDQCRLDDALWRVTARNVDANIFYLRGQRSVKIGRETLNISALIDREQVVEELKHWKKLQAGIYHGQKLIDFLEQVGKPEQYFELSESEKKVLRSEFSAIISNRWRVAIDDEIREFLAKV